MRGACSSYEEEDMCIPGFVEKPEGNSPLGRPRRRWENNVKMYLHEVGWGGGNGLD